MSPGFTDERQAAQPVPEPASDVAGRATMISIAGHFAPGQWAPLTPSAPTHAHLAHPHRPALTPDALAPWAECSAAQPPTPDDAFLEERGGGLGGGATFLTLSPERPAACHSPTPTTTRREPPALRVRTVASPARIAKKTANRAGATSSVISATPPCRAAAWSTPAAARQGGDLYWPFAPHSSGSFRFPGAFAAGPRTPAAGGAPPDPFPFRPRATALPTDDPSSSTLPYKHRHEAPRAGASLSFVSSRLGAWWLAA